ncbi:unnamed protein product [Peniophora sp. CBMAI 1063]|nr:unnamed protein product [Peniophora sp. CBMAI 1063]
MVTQAERSDSNDTVSISPSRLDSVHTRLGELVDDAYGHPAYQTPKVSDQLARANNKLYAACSNSAQLTKRDSMNPVGWMYRAKRRRNVAQAESLMKDAKHTLSVTKLAVSGIESTRRDVEVAARRNSRDS